jgi:integrase
VRSSGFGTEADASHDRVAAKMPFPIHPHMLRHACGFKLANDGHDTRALQHYLGHKNIQHTVRYTELSPARFRDFQQRPLAIAALEDKIVQKAACATASCRGTTSIHTSRWRRGKPPA